MKFGKAVALVAIVALAATGCSKDKEDESAKPEESTTTTVAEQEQLFTPVDVTRLIVGDNAISSGAEAGKLFSCQTTFNGGGASEQGPWFNGDGTWNLEKKEVVSGDVPWTHVFNVTVEEHSISHWQWAALAQLGTFPIPSTDAVYEYDRNPNEISEQEVSYELPANPQLTGTAQCVGGEVGILLTGIALFNSLDAGGRDAVAWEAQDKCLGHPQESGVYHYHGGVPCNLDVQPGTSVVVGYALDGFPITVPRDAVGNLPANADLDECHGRTSEIEFDGQQVSMYHYELNYQFPYSVGCYRGTPENIDSEGGGGTPPPGGGPPPA